jgi:hypothetical protein
MTDDGPLKFSLFDEQDFAEITSEARLAADRLPEPGARHRHGPQAGRLPGRH